MAGIDSYTSLLLHFDGGDGSTTFTDSSLSPKSLTGYGGIAQYASDKKFGVTSCYFDGSNDYITSPANTAFDFGTGDFTIDCWFRYLDVTLTYPGLIANGYTSTTNGLFGIYVDQNNASTVELWFRVSGAWKKIVSSSITKGDWYHLAVVRQSGVFKMYLNGTLQGTLSDCLVDSVNLGYNGLNIGRSPSDGSNGYFKGYIDELRISKGIARWTSNFTPPSEAYSKDIDVESSAGLVDATGAAEFQLNIIDCEPAVVSASPPLATTAIDIEEAEASLSTADTGTDTTTEKYVVSVMALVTSSGQQTDQFLDLIASVPASTTTSGYARTLREVDASIGGVVEASGSTMRHEWAVTQPTTNFAFATGYCGTVVGDIAVWLDAYAELIALGSINRVAIKFPAIYPPIAGDFMSAKTYIYNYALQLLADGTTDLSSNQFKCALMRSTYTPDVDGEEVWSDVDDHEINASGCYDSGGKYVDSISIVRDDALNTVSVVFGTLRWPVDVGEELRDIKGALIYNSSFASLPLVAFFEFETAVYVGQNNTFVVTPVLTLKSGGI